MPISDLVNYNYLPLALHPYLQSSQIIELLHCLLKNVFRVCYKKRSLIKLNKLPIIGWAYFEYCENNVFNMLEEKREFRFQDVNKV